MWCGMQRCEQQMCLSIERAGVCDSRLDLAFDCFVSLVCLALGVPGKQHLLRASGLSCIAGTPHAMLLFVLQRCMCP